MTTREQCDNIRACVNAGVPRLSVAQVFGCSVSHVDNVMSGRTHGVAERTANDITPLLWAQFWARYAECDNDAARDALLRSLLRDDTLSASAHTVRPPVDNTVSLDNEAHAPAAPSVGCVDAYVGELCEAHALTQFECDVTRELCHGNSVRECAATLSVGRMAVQRAIERVQRKLRNYFS